MSVPEVMKCKWCNKVIYTKTGEPVEKEFIHVEKEDYEMLKIKEKRYEELWNAYKEAGDKTWIRTEELEELRNKSEKWDEFQEDMKRLDLPLDVRTWEYYKEKAKKWDSVCRLLKGIG